MYINMINCSFIVRLIKLDNGLRCLLVSDTLPGDQDTAAVAESDGSSDEAVSEGESSTEETEDGDYVGHVCGDEVEAMIGGEKKVIKYTAFMHYRKMKMIYFI